MTKRSFRSVLLASVSPLALRHGVREVGQFERARTAIIPVEGGEITMNVRYRPPALTPEQRQALAAKAAQAAAMRTELFANVVAIGERTTPLMHIHPRTKRIEKFKEMTSE